MAAIRSGKNVECCFDGADDHRILLQIVGFRLRFLNAMRSLFLFFLLHLFRAGVSQSLPDFKSLRYDEDYSFFDQDSSRTFYQKLKFSPLSKTNQVYNSFGGEIRYQYFNIKNEDWGDAPIDRDGYLLSRFLFHADLHLSKSLRLFTQFQGSGANGKIMTRTIDENPLDLHQFFLDVRLGGIVIRVGRQELSYGSQRLVSVREGPNSRHAFDALKVSYSDKNKHTMDLFYGHYVMGNIGIFDDDYSNEVELWGAYIVKQSLPVLQNVDLYYLGLKRTTAMFDDGNAKEIRHSIGARLWSSGSRWQNDVEGLFQFGDFGEKKISAWTITVNSRYKLASLKFQPTFGIKTSLISGDKNYGDDKLQTFNPLFPRGAYFGLAALVGPVNLMDFHPSLSLVLTPRIAWSIDYDMFWRHSDNDGIYAPNASLTYSGRTSSEKLIGRQLATDIQITPNQFLTIGVEFTWFASGQFLKDVSIGKDILFCGITTQFTF